MSVVKPPYPAPKHLVSEEFLWAWQKGAVLIPFTRGGGIPRDIVSGNPITQVDQGVNPTWETAPRAVRYGPQAAADDFDDIYELGADPIGGLSSFTIYSVLYLDSDFYTTDIRQSFGMGKWETGDTVLLLRKESTTELRALANLSTTNADITVTAPLNLRGVNVIVIRLDEGTLSIWANGSNLGEDTGGVGTLATTTEYILCGGQEATFADSVRNLTRGTMQLLGMVPTAINDAQIRGLSRDPFGSIRPDFPTIGKAAAAPPSGGFFARRYYDEFLVGAA